MMRSIHFAFLACLMSAAAPAAAQDKPVSFHNDIRPIFNAACNACHKPEKLKGDLDMTTHAALLKGGRLLTVHLSNRMSLSGADDALQLQAGLRVSVSPR